MPSEFIAFYDVGADIKDEFFPDGLGRGERERRRKEKGRKSEKCRHEPSWHIQSFSNIAYAWTWG